MNNRQFDLEHRIGADKCAQNARDIQNKSIDNYYMFNVFAQTNPTDCKDNAAANKLQEFADVNHVVFRDGYGVANHCRIDDDSKLRNESQMTNDRFKTQIFPRIFQGVPNFARGGFVPNVESRLVQGETNMSHNSCTQLSEINFDRFTPLLSCLQDNVQNPRNIVPEWTWGGEPTRDSVRQGRFLEENGYQFDGSVWKKQFCNAGSK
jgi:hypothetical protein